jgi:hypothetical protein
MINRSFLSLLFAFLLLFAQQQSLVHPLEHLALENLAGSQQKTSDQTQSPSEKQTLPHTDNCSKCDALAGIGSAVSSKSQIVHALSARFEFLSSAKQPIISAHFQPYHSRAPPYLA